MKRMGVKAGVSQTVPEAPAAPGPGPLRRPRQHRGRPALFARPATFIMGVAKLDQLPPADLPEVAFAGRSNVGKSSLINALTGQRSLARTSQHARPHAADQPLRPRRPADAWSTCPATATPRRPRTWSQRWTRWCSPTCAAAPSLLRVCLLIDARHGLKKVDDEVIEMLGKAAVPFQIVLTKVDLVRPAELEALDRWSWRPGSPGRWAPCPHPIPTSARSQRGRRPAARRPGQARPTPSTEAPPP